MSYPAPTGVIIAGTRRTIRADSGKINQARWPKRSLSNNPGMLANCQAKMKGNRGNRNQTRAQLVEKTASDYISRSVLNVLFDVDGYKSTAKRAGKVSYQKAFDDPDEAIQIDVIAGRHTQYVSMCSLPESSGSGAPLL